MHITRNLKKVLPALIFAGLAAGCGSGASNTTAPTTVGTTVEAPVVYGYSGEPLKSVGVTFQTVPVADQYVIEFSGTPTFTGNNVVEGPFYFPYTAGTQTTTSGYDLGNAFDTVSRVYYRVGARSGGTGSYTYSTTSNYFDITGQAL